MTFDTERLRVRDILLDRASDALARAVQKHARRVPAKDLAAFIEGDENEVHQIFVGRRRFIAQKLTSRSPSPKVEALAQLILDAPPTGGFLPCAFIVWLDAVTIDGSVVMLRNEGVS